MTRRSVHRLVRRVGLALLVPAPLLAATAGAVTSPGAGARWFLAALGLLVAGAAAWLGRVFVLPEVGVELSWPARARRALGALVMAVGAYVAVSAPGATLGHGDWETRFDVGLATARQTGQPVIIDAWAEWCGACKEIYANTLEHPDVKTALADYVRIQVDMDRPENEALYERFGFQNLPWIAVFDSAAAIESAAGTPPVPRLVVREAIEPDAFLTRLAGGSSEELSIAGWLSEKGLFLTLLLVFLGGIAVSFTPCVVPVYILTVNVIGARRTKSVWGRLGLSGVYVLGLALTYTVLGVVAGLTSASMAQAFRNPWVVGGIAALFAGMALAYLEIFRLPQAGGLAARITGATRSNVLTAFLLGLAGGLIAAPCVGPMLIGILTYISTQRDAWLGFWLMFTFAIGMGLLFVAIGTSTAILDRLRKAGSWGYRLEMVFAVTFLAVALYYLRQAVPAVGAVFPFLAGLSPL